MDQSGKICKVNIPDIQVAYPVDELVKCLPDERAFGNANKYQAQPKLWKI